MALCLGLESDQAESDISEWLELDNRRSILTCINVPVAVLVYQMLDANPKQYVHEDEVKSFIKFLSAVLRARDWDI